MADNAGMVTTMTSTPGPTSQALVREAADNNGWSLRVYDHDIRQGITGTRWFFSRGRVAVIIDWMREPVGNPTAAAAYIKPDVNADEPMFWQPARPRMAIIETLNWLATPPDKDPT